MASGLRSDETMQKQTKAAGSSASALPAPSPKRAVDDASEPQLELELQSHQRQFNMREEEHTQSYEPRDGSNSSSTHKAAAHSPQTALSRVTKRQRTAQVSTTCSSALRTR